MRFISIASGFLAEIFSFLTLQLTGGNDLNQIKYEVEFLLLI